MCGGNLQVELRFAGDQLTAAALRMSLRLAFKNEARPEDRIFG